MRGFDLVKGDFLQTSPGALDNRDAGRRHYLSIIGRDDLRPLRTAAARSQHIPAQLEPRRVPHDDALEPLPDPELLHQAQARQLLAAALFRIAVIEVLGTA